MRNLAAETLALKALAYIAADGETLHRFLDLSGIDVEELRARANEPETLAAVMDFLSADDTLACGFAEEEGIDGDDLRWARAALPGGSDWTGFN